MNDQYRTVLRVSFQFDTGRSDESGGNIVVREFVRDIRTVGLRQPNKTVDCEARWRVADGVIPIQAAGGRVYMEDNLVG